MMLVVFSVQKREVRVVERWNKMLEVLSIVKVKKTYSLTMMRNFVNNIAHACIRRATHLVWRSHTHEREARGSGVMLDCDLYQRNA